MSASASVLGISPAQMCKLEGNQKTLSRNDLNRFLEQLASRLLEVSRARGAA